jgi:hypothetical protein
MLKPDKGLGSPSEKKAYCSIQLEPQIQESHITQGEELIENWQEEDTKVIGDKGYDANKWIEKHIAILNENGTGSRRGAAPVLGSGKFLLVNQIGLL